MSYEQTIKEARTIEAMKNGYMGLGGKFCLITKKLGHPIIKQGNLYSDMTEFEDIFETEEEDQIKTMDEDESTYEIGWQFDGLSRGINISIIIFFHLREIVVRNEGQIVYKEASGELEYYVPQKDWEEKVNILYNLTKKINKQNKIEENKTKEKQNEEKKKSIIENLRKKWGI